MLSNVIFYIIAITMVNCFPQKSISTEDSILLQNSNRTTPSGLTNDDMLPGGTLHRKSRASMIFPNDDTDSVVSSWQASLKPSGDVIKCANGSTYCTEVDTYPSEYIARMRMPQKYEEFFTYDDYSIDMEFETRMESVTEKPLCHYVEHIIYPKLGETRQGKWEYIINDTKYRQIIRVEKCVHTKKTCDMTDSFPITYRPVCRQKYAYRELIGVSPNGRIRRNTYKMPSCCQCVLLTT